MPTNYNITFIIKFQIHKMKRTPLDVLVYEKIFNRKSYYIVKEMEKFKSLVKVKKEEN